LHHYCRGGGILTSCEKEQMANNELNNKQAIAEAKYFFKISLIRFKKKMAMNKAKTIRNGMSLEKP
jgi:hypothetical protein